MLFVCDLCDAKICSSYKYWTTHLLGSTHQKNLELDSDLLTWYESQDEEEFNSIFVITPKTSEQGHTKSHLTPQNVLLHFCKFGIVSDFYFDPHGGFYIVQYEETYLDNISHNLSSAFQEIEGHSVRIQCKSVINEKSWNTIVGIIDNNEDFKLDEILVKVDLSNPNQRKIVTSSKSNTSVSNEFTDIFKSPQNLPLVDDFISIKFSNLDLQKQLDIFEKSVTLSSTDLKIREEFLKDLGIILKKHYPLCQIHPFGSYLTGLGSISSDIDILMELDPNFEPESNNNTKELPSSEELVDIIKKILRKARIPNSKARFCSKVVGISKARIPIVKLIHSTSGINADISFENHLSVQNSKLICYYMSLDPRVKTLTLLIKFWAQSRNLIGSQKIKSYGLVLMILTFLMKKRIIPTVQELQAKVDPSEVIEIEGWNASFCTSSESSKKTKSSKSHSTKQTFPSENVMELAQEFFSTFAKIDLGNLIICPLLGIFIPNMDFQPEREKKLPRAFSAYKELIEEDPDFRLDFSGPICIQDPFDLAFNVCNITHENTVHKFQSDSGVTERRIQESFSKHSKKLNLLSLFCT